MNAYPLFMSLITQNNFVPSTKLSAETSDVVHAAHSGPQAPSVLI